MCILILFVALTVIGIALYFFEFEFSGIITAFLGILGLISCLILVPANRADVRAYYLEYQEMQESIKDMSQIDGVEKAAIYNQVIKMNLLIQKNKYYARSPWVDIFYDPIIFKMNPIRIKK